MTLDQASPKKHVVIMDNVPEWRDQIGSVVKDVFGDSVEVHFAEGAREALRIIEEIEAMQGETASQVAMVLADLHVSEDGSNNGDVLISSLMERKKPAPPTAIVSGTFMDETKKRLSESVPGLPLLDKGSFREANKGSAGREVLELNLRRMMDGKLPPLPNDPEIIKVLRSMKDQLRRVSHMGMFIDQVVSKVSCMWRKYGDFLAAVPEAAEFKECNLYDNGEITGHLLHEFKNYLPNLIDEVKSMAQVPAGLVEELVDLSIYVTRVFAEISKEKESINLAKAVSGTVANFNRFSGDRVCMQALGDEVADIEVNIAPEKLYLMLGEMIRNALRHSKGPVTVYIKDKTVVVINDYEGKGEFSLRIEQGKVLEGSLPEESSSDIGSAHGLKMLTKMMEEPRATTGCIKFSLSGSSDRVFAKLDLENAAVRKNATEPALAESRERNRELPEVVFICHDHTPEETFKKILGTPVEGFNYHCLKWPSGNIDRWCDENEDLLMRACIVVAHMGPGEVESMATPLVARFPHLVVLPANMYPENMQVDQYREYSRYGMNKFAGAKRMLSASELAECEVGEAPRYLYNKSYRPPEWERILHVAHQMATAAKQKESK
ncbi:MAG: hypothetical protein WCT53_05345 [Candidatus Gracilibacteria bacterium]